mgnify:CR=1 FL=1
MYPWISRTLDFWLQFCEKKCGLYMDVYGSSKFKMSMKCQKPKPARMEYMARTVERRVQSKHHEQHPPQDYKQEISQQKRVCGTCRGYCFGSLDMQFLVAQIAATRDASLISTCSNMILFVQIWSHWQVIDFVGMFLSQGEQNNIQFM